MSGGAGIGGAIIGATLQLIEGRILAAEQAGEAAIEATLPDTLKPYAAQVSTWATAWVKGQLDAIDIPLLEQSLPGQLVAFVQQGGGPSVSSDADL